MFPLQEETRKKSPKEKAIAGFLFLLLAIGTTFATTLTINTNNQLTFGQGVFLISACDTWIDISFQKTSTDDGVLENGVRVQAVSAVVIKGFSASACKNKNFKVKLFKNTAPTTPLELYQQEDGTNSNQVWLSVNNAGVVSLLDSYGRDIGEYGDTAIGLAQDSENGDYTAYFFTPVQPASNVDKFTVESGPNA